MSKKGLEILESPKYTIDQYNQQQQYIYKDNQYAAEYTDYNSANNNNTNQQLQQQQLEQQYNQDQLSQQQQQKQKYNQNNRNPSYNPAEQIDTYNNNDEEENVYNNAEIVKKGEILQNLEDEDEDDDDDDVLPEYQQSKMQQQASLNSRKQSENTQQINNNNNGQNMQDNDEDEEEDDLELYEKKSNVLVQFDTDSQQSQLSNILHENNGNSKVGSSLSNNLNLDQQQSSKRKSKIIENGGSVHKRGSKQNQPKTVIIQPENVNIDFDTEMSNSNTVTEKQRYDNNFFGNQLKNRSGFPTISNKKRQMGINQLKNMTDKTPGGLDDDNNQQQFASGGSQPHSNKQLQGGVKKLAGQFAQANGTERVNNQLMIELNNIEQHQHFRKLMEGFLIEFKKKPKIGIQFAIDKTLCKNTPDSIASFLINIEGINKDQLGQYFGSKDEKNQQVMRSYFKLLDFRQQDFLLAVRSLLARFKLAGEADQISRVVEEFGKVFMKDNPGYFHHEDVPYIITYSAIQLNVNLHNDRVRPEHKQKKEDFVNITMACLNKKEYKFNENGGKEQLESIYDGILNQKFETKIDNVEDGIEKIMAIYSNNQSSDKDILLADAKQMEKIKEDLQIEKHHFLKYGRKGKPHARVVYLNKQGDQVCWKDVGKAHDNPRSIRLSDITDLAMGSQTTEVFLKNIVPIEFDNLCFSIIAKQRTLDLQIDDKQMKYKWCYFLFHHLMSKKRELTRHITQKRRKQINHEKIDEIWKVDIFPYWDQHWDYKIDKPKNFQKIEEKTFLQKICPCIPGIGGINNPNKLKSMNTQGRANQMDNTETQKLSAASSAQGGLFLEDMSKSKKTKSLLLISLWKLGIPSWARSTIWPLAIGNRLELTEALYINLLRQVDFVQQQKDQNKNDVSKISQMDQHMLSQMQEIDVDLNNLIEFENNTQDGHLLKENFEKKKEIIKKTLQAFIFYRPDVGYVKNSMIRIAYMLVQYLDELQTFFCFVNLLHSYHFLSFFRGDMREIEWRVQFFNQHLSKKMALVYSHFKSIDLSTEVFLMHWFLSLFTNSLNDIQFLSRIWDNFFLEGEVFPFKLGMAIINFFQLELKMSTFDKALDIVKNFPQISQEHLFEIIQKTDIPWQEYEKELHQQKVALQKPLINQVMFNI